MKNILEIIKKEFFRFFKDKRMVITTILLPGLMIYIMYSFMGNFMIDALTPDDDYKYKVYIYNESLYMENLRNKIDEALEEQDESFILHDITKDPEVDVADAIELVKNKELDLVIVYPLQFENFSGQDDILKIYYNSTNTNSSSAYEYYVAYYNAIEQSISNAFDINTDTEDTYDVSSDEEKSGQFFSMMLPMLLMIFLFSGCISVAPESIAGEKERGTIATLLVTPINRRDLAIGKIISLSAISLLSGLSSFLGTMLSLPKLLGDETSEIISANVYGFKEYATLLLIILSCVILFTTVISVISAYAKSVKEASTMISPIMIVVAIIGMTSMLTNSIASNHILYLIPIFNCIQVMSSIFSFTVIPLNIVITLVTNLVFSAGLVYLLTKMFNSEKVMFNK